MKFTKWVGGVAVAVVLVLGTSIAPAWAHGTQGLPWRSPHKITSGVPFHVASIAPCPPVPTPGDTILVGISLSFGAQGSVGDVLPANPRGSWSGTLTFNFSGVNLRRTTISAQCLDFNGVTGVPYAEYRVHRTKIFD